MKRACSDVKMIGRAFLAVVKLFFFSIWHVHQHKSVFSFSLQIIVWLIKASFHCAYIMFKLVDIGLKVVASYRLFAT